MASYTPGNQPQACPTQDAVWAASTKLPPSPNEAVCSCMTQSLNCTAKSSISADDVETNFNYLCDPHNGDFCSGILANGSTGVYGATPCVMHKSGYHGLSMHSLWIKPRTTPRIPTRATSRVSRKSKRPNLPEAVRQSLARRETRAQAQSHLHQRLLRQAQEEALHLRAPVLQAHWLFLALATARSNWPPMPVLLHWLVLGWFSCRMRGRLCPACFVAIGLGRSEPGFLRVSLRQGFIFTSGWSWMAL